MIHDTDALLNKITGSSDYVKELEKLTGNIESINMDYFENVLKSVNESDKVIRSYIKEVPEIGKEYFTLSISSGINNPIETIKKKSKKSEKTKYKKVINPLLKPKTFIRSPFFKLVKKLEKTCNNLIESYNLNKGIEGLETILKTNPELMETKNFFGYHLKETKDITMIKTIKKESNNIISLYMLPMYDLMQTMDKNWHLIGSLFNSMVSDISVAEVKDMLYLFLVAKYRCTITENDKYYMKLFMSIINKQSETSGTSGTSGANGTSETNEINESNATEVNAKKLIGEMDAARFLELLDTINLDSIDNKETVYKFATKAKEIIKRIVNKKDNETMEDIMKDVENMFIIESQKQNDKNNEEKQTIESTEKINENEDVLSNI